RRSLRHLQLQAAARLALLRRRSRAVPRRRPATPWQERRRQDRDPAPAPDRERAPRSLPPRPRAGPRRRRLREEPPPARPARRAEGRVSARDPAEREAEAPERVARGRGPATSSGRPLRRGGAGLRCAAVSNPEELAEGAA